MIFAVEIGDATLIVGVLTVVVAGFTGLLARRNTKEHQENGARLERMEGKIDTVVDAAGELKLWQVKHELFHERDGHRDLRVVVEGP